MHKIGSKTVERCSTRRYLSTIFFWRREEEGGNLGWSTRNSPAGRFFSRAQGYYGYVYNVVVVKILGKIGEEIETLSMLIFSGKINSFLISSSGRVRIFNYLNIFLKNLPSFCWKIMKIHCDCFETINHVRIMWLLSRKTDVITYRRERWRNIDVNYTYVLLFSVVWHI